MKRRVLFCLSLLVCLARLLPSGTTISSEAALSDNPVLQCRAKRPFPFDASQFTKKRLSSPPEPGHASVVVSPLIDHSAACDTPFCLHEAAQIVAPNETSDAAVLPTEAALWVAGAIERNVFHPPPAA